MSKKPNRTKSVPLTFYVTEADSQRIHCKAKACGVSLTKYLTDCAVGKEIIRIDALTEFTKALKAQGNNLNQLTTLANMGRITAVNVQEACALYADIQRSLKTLLERTV
ncbi:plasmid mobilization relaxosome protein MobC [uncultured Oscillibacter sp.]|uniref:plasmid mobilization protein n=1 Tax=uncultured Oscillibacter sp. TaxID=876091 RepID=UPI00280C3866|nr:plasmid mobilization relaxosome protein MobC [uncultured Oscillibacter sp.]